MCGLMLKFSLKYNCVSFPFFLIMIKWEKMYVYVLCLNCLMQGVLYVIISKKIGGVWVQTSNWLSSSKRGRILRQASYKFLMKTTYQALHNKRMEKEDHFNIAQVFHGSSKGIWNSWQYTPSAQKFLSYIIWSL